MSRPPAIGSANSPLDRRSWGLALLLLLAIAADGGPPRADLVIRRRAGVSDIVITTTSRLAGAIHSLTWNGKEFIDSADHGRQLQSAANFDAGRPFVPEVFNPTEAGSMSDGAGSTSTSRLLESSASANELRTKIQMAFWLAPGETSAGHPALNTKRRSDHRVEKRVRIGVDGLDHAIAYDVTFSVPEGERHVFGQFEALTGYMPAEFDDFKAFDPQTKGLRPLDDGPGEQPLPVVFSTANGRHAMGVYSPDRPDGYGRFRFPAERVNKWNCVFRERDPNGIRPGAYRYRLFLAVGSRDDVVKTLSALVDRFR